MFDRFWLWYLNIAQCPRISDDCSALLLRQGAFSMRISRWSGVVAAANFMVAAVGFSSASAVSVSTVGMAVGSVGSTKEVGIKDNTHPGLGGEAIKYFIPLGNTDGTYGVGKHTCGGTGFGTCSDHGDGGGTLKMILYFSPVSTAYSSLLTIRFEDLDLKGANDPEKFFESLNLFRGNTSLTGLITDIGGLVTGDKDHQTLNLLLDKPLTGSLWVVLKFKAKSYFDGENTAEYLRATLTEVSHTPPVATPLPGALVLMGSVLAGCFGIGRWRRRTRPA
jgi:hypothetical protein